MFKIISICKGGGYKYCRTDPPHPKRNSKGLYPLHRVILENKLGRLLKDNEESHHKDENKENDDPSNLEVLIKSEHARLHNIKNAPPKVKLLCLCGKEFQVKPHVFRRRLKASKSKKLFCSRSCGTFYWYNTL